MRTWGAIWPGSAPMWVLMAATVGARATSRVLGSDRASCSRRVPARRTPWTWPCPSAATSGSGSGAPTTPGSPRPGPTRRRGSSSSPAAGSRSTDDARRRRAGWRPPRPPRASGCSSGSARASSTTPCCPPRRSARPTTGASCASSGRTCAAVDRGFLVQAQAMWEWRRAHRFCGRCGGGLVAARGGYVAAVRGLRAPALPAHRPGRDHARHRRRPGAARPAGGLAEGPLLHAGRLRRPGGEPRGRGGARGPGGGRHRGHRRDLLRQPALAVPLEPHGGLLRPRASPPTSSSTTTRSRRRAGSAATSCAPGPRRARWRCRAASRSAGR